MSALTELESQVIARYRQIHELMAAAAERAGRNPEEVRLVGVTKYVGVEGAAALVRAGCRDLGESRPQSLWEKSERLPPDVRWHLIGHLQRNKVRRTLPHLHLIHSLDSMRLTEQIAQDATTLNVMVCGLLEINLTNDASKTGLSPQNAVRWLEEYTASEGLRQRVQIQGLMGMSSLTADVGLVRAEFAQLRSLRDAWRQEFHFSLPELSMGMSDDFEIAIEEGATLVRIGSRLFPKDAN